MSSVATINQNQVKPLDIAAIEAVLLHGDLSKMNAEQKVIYYNKVCDLTGLNPITQPFNYLRLNGKEVLYANKGCAEQLRSIHKIGLKIVSRDKIEEVYVVTAEALDPSGRTDAATGAVNVAGLRGEALANAMMKAETKAKRRVTLSICGLNILDDTEVDSIPNAHRIFPDGPTEEDHQKAREVLGYTFPFGSFKFMNPREAFEKKGRDAMVNALTLIEAKLEKNETYKGVTFEDMKEAVRQIETVLAEVENAPIDSDVRGDDYDPEYEGALK